MCALGMLCVSGMLCGICCVRGRPEKSALQRSRHNNRLSFGAFPAGSSGAPYYHGRATQCAHGSATQRTHHGYWKQRGSSDDNLNLRDYLLAEIKIWRLGFRRRNLILISKKVLLISQIVILMSKILSEIKITIVFLGMLTDIKFPRLLNP